MQITLPTITLVALAIAILLLGFYWGMNWAAKRIVDLYYVIDKRQFSDAVRDGVSSGDIGFAPVYSNLQPGRPGRKLSVVRRKDDDKGK